MMQRKKKNNLSVVDTNLIHLEKVIIICIIWSSSCVIFIQFLTGSCLCKTKNPTHKQADKPKNQTQTNPKSETESQKKPVSLFSGLAQSCATLNLVFFSSDTVDSVSNQDGCHYGTHEIYC